MMPMERHGPPAVAALLALFLGACDLQTPAGGEPQAPAEPARSVAEGAGVAAAPADEPAGAAVVAKEPAPLSLRFVSPNRGPAAGGNEVTIDGQGFGGYPRVHFGGVLAWIRRVTPTEIRVTVPPTTAGDSRMVDVTVTNPPAGPLPPVSATLIQAYSYNPPAGATDAGETPQPQAGTPPPPATPTGAEPAVEAERAPAGPALVARFRFEKVSESGECEPGRNIRFTDRSTGGATGWLWEFGDGESSAEQHPEHCYATPGLRSVNLSVSNDQQSSSASEIVIVGMQ